MGLSDGQTPSEEPGEALVEVLEPSEELMEHPALDQAPIVIHRRNFPDLIPEWVPKLQTLATGAALLFAAVAVVVERHEQRYHHHAPDDVE